MKVSLTRADIVTAAAIAASIVIGINKPDIVPTLLQVDGQVLVAYIGKEGEKKA